MTRKNSPPLFFSHRHPKDDFCETIILGEVPGYGVGSVRQSQEWQQIASQQEAYKQYDGEHWKREQLGRMLLVSQGCSLSAFSRSGIIRTTGPLQNTEIGSSTHWVCAA
jgi:hypothetical protein